MFYTFPKDIDLCRKWLEACGKNVNSQIKHERVCEVHFKAECIESQLAKPQSNKIQARVIRRLKKGSVPTEFLNLPSGRKKRLHSYPQSCINELPKKLIRTGVPTYAELVVCSKGAIDASDLTKVQASLVEDDVREEIVDLIEVETSSVEDNVREQNMNLTKSIGVVTVAKDIACTNPEPANLSTSSVEQHIWKKDISFILGNGRGVEYSNSSIIDMLLARLKKVEEENTELKAQLHQKYIAMDCMKKDVQKYADKFTTDILRKMFTSGQVKIISPIDR